MRPALIDTDIVSYFLKGNDKVYFMFQEYLRQFETINISSITYYEIEHDANDKQRDDYQTCEIPSDRLKKIINR